VLFSRVGAVLARVGFVRLCLDLLGRGSTAMPQRVSRAFGTEAATTLRRLVGEVQKMPREVWPMAQAHWSRPASFQSMAAHLAALPRSAAALASAPDLGDLPLAVITAGTQSESGRAAHARLAALSTRGRQILVPGAGHWTHLDAPDLVVDAIRTMMREVRAEERDTSNT
jgi:pimeloyl-ACP methyl ester carboxylesterase